MRIELLCATQEARCVIDLMPGSPDCSKSSRLKSKLTKMLVAIPLIKEEQRYVEYAAREKSMSKWNKERRKVVKLLIFSAGI